MSICLPPLPELHVDLDTLVRNYQCFAELSSPAETGAAVKANAYGLGISAIAPALYQAGCNTFFVAHTREAIELRQLIGPKPIIYVLHGLTPQEAYHFLNHDLRPVLNSQQQIEIWRKTGKSKPAALHFDTGINRLGLSFQHFANTDVHDLNLSLIMSHLACGSSPQHSLNAQQLGRFGEIHQHFAHIPASLSNSAGILIGSQFHFDLTRPGIGLYGGNPFDKGHVGISLGPVASLLAPVLQVKSVKAGDIIGYGASFCAPKAMKIAILAYGYADGLFRAASPGAYGWIDGQAIPLLGRVSMDLVIVDISHIERSIEPGERIAFFGADLDDFAKTCNTIVYEVLTQIGPRVKRIYSGSES